MTNTVMNFTKGVIAGVVVGATIGAAVSSAVKPVSPLKKNTAKAIKMMTGVMQNFAGTTGAK